MTRKNSSYKELKKELEKVIGELQSEETDIDDALELYKKANKIIEQLEKHLETIKIEIERINRP